VVAAEDEAVAGSEGFGCFLEGIRCRSMKELDELTRAILGSKYCGRRVEVWIPPQTSCASCKGYVRSDEETKGN
jgi:hypothetical protein